MKRTLWIAFSVLVILSVAFMTARGCAKKKGWESPWSAQELAEIKSRLHPEVKSKPRVPKKATASEPPAITQRAAPKAKLAIILDDWGNNYSLVEDAVAINRPLTLSILPGLAQSKRIAERAYAKQLGVMLHLPMQPVGEGHALEPNTILVSMDDAQIRSIVENAITGVPHLTGANNHQGSRATSDKRVMRSALSVIKKHGLFFVDSNTIKSSQAASLSRQMGIPYAERHVFLDNQADGEAISKQMRRAIQLAKSKGKAVAIGHDKKITLQTIRDMLPEIDREKVELVLVSDLLEGIPAGTR